jgi:asparagine synthase (glutamine-hydrolysing)
MKRFREKYVLRRAVEGALPREIAWRPKFGMRAPWQQWATGNLPAFAEELLSERALRATGYFDPQAVQALRRRAGDRRQRSTPRQLMTVLIVQLWDHLFVSHRRR